VQMVEVERQACVYEEIDVHAIQGSGRLVPQTGQFRQTLLRDRHAALEAGDDLRFGPDMHHAAVAIDDHEVAVFGPRHQALETAHGWNAHRPRTDWPLGPRT